MANTNPRPNSKISKRVLIVLATTQGSGGISNYFKILELYKYENISYFTFYGSSKNILQRIFLPFIYIKFLIKCKNFDLVHLNTSMNQNSFYRDSVIALLTRLYKKPLVTFWHGWDEIFENRVHKNKSLEILFNNTFNHSVAYIVLSKIFEKKLASLSKLPKQFSYITPPVETNYETSTLIENKLAAPIHSINFLFLSRIEINKGIYIVLESFKQLQKKGYKNINLSIAGVGNELENAKSYVRDNKIEYVTFYGFISGEEKQSVLMDSDVLFFPTYYPEGLPTVILESMYFGLLVITRSVAGIPEHIENDANGFITDSLEPTDYAAMLDKICNDHNYIRKIGHYNHKIAKEQYSKKCITEILLKIYERC